MSNSDPMVIPASSEFIALCQSQIALLTQTLGATWSAVYLTEELGEDSEADLIPIAVYPQTSTFEPQIARLTAPGERSTERKGHLLAAAQAEASEPGIQPIEIDIDAPKFQWEELSWPQRHQIVLPLIYEEVVMGLLIAARQDRDWNESELTQIEKIAKSLAIARLLDRRQDWYQQQLRNQQNRRRLERDRLDDLLHQLRNPLTALKTFSKLLLKQILPEDRHHQIVQGMGRESDRFQELLEEFEADLGELEVETPPLKPREVVPVLPEGNSIVSVPALETSHTLELETISVREVIEPLLVSLSAIAQNKNIELTAAVSPNLSLVRGNAKALREVLNNLIDNALKYTPNGGKVDIQVESAQITPKGRMEAIIIRDTGYGIPPQDRQRIFERHYRGVQERGDISGSGLGLAIVRELVAQMGGEIEVISPNELSQDSASLPGTTFIIWLPLM